VEDVDNDDEAEELDEDVMEDGGAIELVVVMEDIAPVTDIVVVAAAVDRVVATGTAVVIAVEKASVDAAVTVGDAVVAEMLNPRCVEAPRV